MRRRSLSKQEAADYYALLCARGAGVLFPPWSGEQLRHVLALPHAEKVKLLRQALLLRVLALVAAIAVLYQILYYAWSA